MKRTMSRREKLLLTILVVLLIGLCYYSFYLSPLNSKIDNYKSMTNSALDEEIALEPMMTSYNKMKNELTELRNSSDSKPIPNFDNSKNVMDELHNIMSEATSYSLSFSGTTEENSIVSRPVGISFVAASYDNARDIIDKLYESDYSNQISNITYFKTSGGVQVTLTTTFYELHK